MNEKLKQIKVASRLCITDLTASDEEITEQRMLGTIKEYVEMLSGLDEDDIEAIRRKIEKNIQVVMGVADCLFDEKTFVDWLTEERKNEISWYYWNRFDKYSNEKDIPKPVLQRTDSDTDLILKHLGDPKSEEPFSRRGMVIGDVQAGKTNNYSALINKASDAGYKIIVVLSGMIGDLREQTQKRLDEDYVGRKSYAGRVGTSAPIGVGQFGTEREPICLTDREQDFVGAGNFSLRSTIEPTLIVTIKNASRLRRLSEWLDRQKDSDGLMGQPMLFIDDEADNASVNTGKEEEDPKTINKLIRQILSKCKRASYVAYTATPFANIFIDPDSAGDKDDTQDLFPRDFMFVLQIASNYCGAKYYFGDEENSERINQSIDTEAAKSCLPLIHKNDVEVNCLPNDCEEAIATYFVACAIKKIRRERYGEIRKPYDSMLINMSRLQIVQNDIKPLVEIEVKSLYSAVRQNAGYEDGHKRSDNFKKIYDAWIKHYASCPEDWAQVRNALLEVPRPDVIVIHGDSPDELNYEEGTPNKIVIGGLKLSRGLTLDGLVVSYFYRRSVMADAMLQMGRWFGYHDGYKDLLKLWLTPESLTWYEHTVTAVDDLKSQIADMIRKKRTPADYAMRVKDSETALIITALNKMRTAKEFYVDVGFSDRTLQTVFADCRPEIIQSNFDVFEEALDTLQPYRYFGEDVPEAHRRHRIHRNVPVSFIKDLCSNLVTHPSNLLWASSDLFNQYLDARSEKELAIWDVNVLVRGDGKGKLWRGNKNEFLMLERSVPEISIEPEKPYEWKLSRNGNISTPTVDLLGLSGEEIKNLYDLHGRSKRQEFRKARLRPSLTFLVIEAITETDKNERDGVGTPLLCWVFSIPPTDEKHPTVKYKVAKKWFEHHFAILSDETSNSP